MKYIEIDGERIVLTSCFKCPCFQRSIVNGMDLEECHHPNYMGKWWRVNRLDLFKECPLREVGE